MTLTLPSSADAPDQTEQAVQRIRQHVGEFRPRIGMILGSGLGGLARAIENAIVIPYAALPGFPQSLVEGHAGEVVLGRLGGVELMCMRGRQHFYEGHGTTGMTKAVRTMKRMGCDRLIVTCAAGSLRPELEPGRLVAIKDHINLLPGNPLIGPNDDQIGPRFCSMANAYDKDLRQGVQDVAQALGLPWAEGVYVAFSGPTFETAAEIRMMQVIGGDVVGMSTVPEVISARHCGLRVLAIACITNLGEGIGNEVLSHELTLQYGSMASVDLQRLIVGWFEQQAATAKR
ncbi:purine-nucleoside phosphorylase [Cupriavidus pinatubonensis]|uniref:Purine nucleoside phosphorylase n=1 Tax=Cupriavidus pinatubonensis TaxID=248026 RepID=A0ABN7ZNB8_9BURK|nr:purine-nucleoside phosphorylase [Cupriavidus pinatubonensis]CAG9185621.1 Purine nucleoside phosphorylase 2 [Cupriavidus pinatubonensis]